MTGWSVYRVTFGGQDHDPILPEAAPVLDVVAAAIASAMVDATIIAEQQTGVVWHIGDIIRVEEILRPVYISPYIGEGGTGGAEDDRTGAGTADRALSET